MLAAVGALEDSAVDDLASECVRHAQIALLAWRLFAHAILLTFLAMADTTVIAWATKDLSLAHRTIHRFHCQVSAVIAHWC